MPNFLSPENVKKNEYTRYSDIWSLGCLLIEMITGLPPYPEFKNPVSVLYHISHAMSAPGISSEINISKELEDFLDCCLKINPKERSNVNELLRHPFITGDIIVKRENTNTNNSIVYDISKFNSKGINAFFNNNNNLNNININTISNNPYNNNINMQLNQISIINNDNSNNNFLVNSNENENEDYAYMEILNKHKESEISEK